VRFLWVIAKIFGTKIKKLLKNNKKGLAKEIKVCII
jgi:hypothetical protein